ncbi:MAG: MotA/TolQ/ExbB proton channel family protein [Verrucomicrobiota bacterium]
MIKKLSTFNIRWSWLVVLSAIILAGASPTWAQDAGAEEVARDKTFVEVFLSGGLTMWFLLIESVVVVTFTIEGFIKFRKARLAPPAVVALLRDAMYAGNYQQAYEVCMANPCFVSRILAIGIERIGRGKEIVEAAIGDVAAAEAVRLKNNLNFLSVVGVTAPMFGLLGTVIGMIGAFETLGSSGVADMTSLSANIAVVLVTTAGGLVVAIPAFILYYVLKGQAAKVIIAADSEVSRLLEVVPYEQVVGMDFTGQ